jgi:hypothetical protein
MIRRVVLSMTGLLFMAKRREQVIRIIAHQTIGG